MGEVTGRPIPVPEGGYRYRGTGTGRVQLRLTYYGSPGRVAKFAKIAVPAQP